MLVTSDAGVFRVQLTMPLEMASLGVAAEALQEEAAR